MLGRRNLPAIQNKGKTEKFEHIYHRTMTFCLHIFFFNGADLSIQFMVEQRFEPMTKIQTIFTTRPDGYNSLLRVVFMSRNSQFLILIEGEMKSISQLIRVKNIRKLGEIKNLELQREVKKITRKVWSTETTTAFAFLKIQCQI